MPIQCSLQRLNAYFTVTTKSYNSSGRAPLALQDLGGLGGVQDGPTFSAIAGVVASNAYLRKALECNMLVAQAYMSNCSVFEYWNAQVLKQLLGRGPSPIPGSISADSGVHRFLGKESQYTHY